MQSETIASLQEQLAAMDAGSLEATVNDVDSELVMLSACVAAAMSGEPFTTTEPTTTTVVTTVETTTVEETEPPLAYVAYPESDGMVCGSDMPVPRTFKYDTGSADECSAYCEADTTCNYFSVSDAKCIGCTEIPAVSNQHTGGYTSYAMTSRRRLSEEQEIEALRTQNAELRALLEQISN